MQEEDLWDLVLDLYGMSFEKFNVMGSDLEMWNKIE